MRLASFTLSRRKMMDIDAMTCWHYIAPLIPARSEDPVSISIYVNTFHAFQLLEKEQEEQKKKMKKETKK